ncbi:hypothetical protein Tco_0117410 [Tanacetum coccineum]
MTSPPHHHHSSTLQAPPSPPYFPVKVTEHLMARSGTDLKMAKLLASAAICQKWGCYRLVSRATVIENKVVNKQSDAPHPSHPTSDIEDAFSSNFLDYTPTSPDYFPVLLGNISHDPSDNLSKYLLASRGPFTFLRTIDPYMRAYNPGLLMNHLSHHTLLLIHRRLFVPPSTPVLPLSPMFDSRDFFPPEEISPPKDTKTPVESPIPISPSSISRDLHHPR